MFFVTGRPALIRPAAIILALSLAGGSCSWFSSGGGGNRSSRGANANSNAEAQAPIVAITVGKSEARPVSAVIRATGTLTAQESSDIASKVAGKVSNVYVNVGDFVAAGGQIAKLDDTEARQQLAVARATVRQREADVRQAEARLGLGPNGRFNASAIPEVRAAAAAYEQALAELRQAEANEKRYRELIESGDVAMVTYEQFRTARDTARARANAAKDQLDAAVNQARQNNQAIAGAQAQLAAARTQVSIQQQAIADTVIRSPFSGFISARPIAVGEFVSTANPVATILRTNPMKIIMQVAEADVSFVTVGRGVSLEVDAFKDRRFAGYVSAVNPQVDPTSRAASVEALIDNNGNVLKAGMFATVRINREGGSTGVFVPRAAVRFDETTQGNVVFEIQDNVAKHRVVQLGNQEGDAVEILSGIEPDKIVATSSLEQLYEGAKVSF